MNLEKNEIQNELVVYINKLRSFTLMTILVVSICMCIAVIGVDSLKIVNDEYMEEYSYRIENYTYEQLRTFDSFVSEHEFNMHIYSTKVGEVLSSNLEDDDDLLLEVLSDYLGENENYLFTYIGLESQSMLLKPDTELPDGYDPTGRPWYVEAAYEGNVTWSTPYMDASTGQMIITLSAPVKHPDTGQLLGVIGKDINYASILDSVSDWQVTDAGYYVLVDNDGTILMHPDMEQVGLPVPIMEIEEAIRSGIIGTVKYSFNGKEKLVNILRYHPLDLIILYSDEVPRSEFSTFDIRYIMVFIIGAILVLSMVYQRFTWMRNKVVNQNVSQPVAYHAPTQSIDKSIIREKADAIRNQLNELDRLL